MSATCGSCRYWKPYRPGESFRECIAIPDKNDHDDGRVYVDAPHHIVGAVLRTRHDFSCNLYAIRRPPSKTCRWHGDCEEETRDARQRGITPLTCVDQKVVNR